MAQEERQGCLTAKRRRQVQAQQARVGLQGREAARQAGGRRRSSGLQSASEVPAASCPGETQSVRGNTPHSLLPGARLPAVQEL